MDSFNHFEPEVRAGVTNQRLGTRITLELIIENLQKPGRDPRESLPKPLLRTDVMKMEDLKEGQKLEGTVRNVVDFGASPRSERPVRNACRNRRFHTVSQGYPR
ncbi:MAG: hypothetical protein RI561_12220 [Gracilimonas sp.]|nr:hypothetical protein [Gracilimonas sp.]